MLERCQRGVDFGPFVALQPDLCLHGVDSFSRAHLGFNAAAAYTSWLFLGSAR